MGVYSVDFRATGFLYNPTFHWLGLGQASACGYTLMPTAANTTKGVMAIKTLDCPL